MKLTITLKNNQLEFHEERTDPLHDSLLLSNGQCWTYSQYTKKGTGYEEFTPQSEMAKLLRKYKSPSLLQELTRLALQGSRAARLAVQFLDQEDKNNS